MKRNHDAIDNSVLMMAIDLLKNGKYALHSDDYEYNLVDYRRDPSLTYTPLIKWNEVGANPLRFVHFFAQHAHDSGSFRYME